MRWYVDVYDLRCTIYEIIFLFLENIYLNKYWLFFNLFLTFSLIIFLWFCPFLTKEWIYPNKLWYITRPLDVYDLKCIINFLVFMICMSHDMIESLMYKDRKLLACTSQKCCEACTFNKQSDDLNAKYRIGIIRLNVSLNIIGYWLVC